MKLKLHLTVLLLLGSVMSLLSQVITTNPVFPTASDAVVITFNADKGDMGLKDYTGDDLYAHTGVITDKSTGGSDWKYVIAPSIREFYGVPLSEKILKLAFVFRNTAITNTRTGREVGEADIFYNVTSAITSNEPISFPYTISCRAFSFIPMNHEGGSIRSIF